jgi:hypothetical protein
LNKNAFVNNKTVWFIAIVLSVLMLGALCACGASEKIYAVAGSGESGTEESSLNDSDNPDDLGDPGDPGESGKSDDLEGSGEIGDLSDSAEPGAQTSPDNVPDIVDPAPLQNDWALVNLILAIISLLTAISAIAVNADNRRRSRKNGLSSKTIDMRRRRKLFPTVVALISAILSVVVFMLTEDLRRPMEIIDNWTILMAIIFVFVAIVSMFAARKDDDDEETEAGE